MALFDLDSPWLGALAGMLNKLLKVKLALWVGKALSALGLGFAAQQFLYEPLINEAVIAWQLIPAGIANWVHALGLDQGVSILLSAYGIQGVQRVFLSRKYEAPI